MKPNCKDMASTLANDTNERRAAKLLRGLMGRRCAEPRVRLVL
jgi:hypothetical protein